LEGANSATWQICTLNFDPNYYYPQNSWDPTCTAYLQSVPLFQWSILVKNQTCLLNKFSFLHLKLCKIIFKRCKMGKTSSMLSGVRGVCLATSWTSLPIQTRLPFRLLTCYK
jgi:hypothetical protein